MLDMNTEKTNTNPEEKMTKLEMIDKIVKATPNAGTDFYKLLLDSSMWLVLKLYAEVEQNSKSEVK